MADTFEMARFYRGPCWNADGSRVRCVQTGDEFPTMAAAARWLEQYTGQRTHNKTVIYAIQRQKNICGLSFVSVKSQTVARKAVA